MTNEQQQEILALIEKMEDKIHNLQDDLTDLYTTLKSIA